MLSNKKIILFYILFCLFPLILVSGQTIFIDPKNGQERFVTQVCKELEKIGLSRSSFIIVDHKLSSWVVPFRNSCPAEFTVLTSTKLPTKLSLSKLSNANPEILNIKNPLLVLTRPFTRSKEINLSYEDYVSTNLMFPVKKSINNMSVWVGKWDSGSSFENLSIFQDIKVDQRFIFNSTMEGASILGDGWSIPEAWGVWSEGSESYLNFRVVDFREKQREIEISGVTYQNLRDESLTVTAYINDIYIGNYRFEKLGSRIIMKFKFLQDDSSKITVKLKYSKTISPAQNFVSDDQRQLAIGIMSLSVH